MPTREQVAKLNPSVDGTEDPFYVLLEDDSLITGFEVKTERLLEPRAEQWDVHLVVTVIVRPSTVDFENVGYLGGWTH
jgi:hypothetical protein